MTNIFHRVFPPAAKRPAVPPGMYHRMLADPPASPQRLHLRVEPDGRGMLIVNASTVLHLNETATAHAWHMVQGAAEDEAADWMARRFRIDRNRAKNDGRRIRDQIESLALQEDLDPVLVMGLDRDDPYQARPAVPYRLDLALTYRLADGKSMDPHARRRVRHELHTESWKAVLDQAWSIGIPHVVFVGGDPTVRTDLVDLVRHAETLGMVTGVVVSGPTLLRGTLLPRLSAAGLDHLLVVVDLGDPQSLKGLRRAAGMDVFCAAHITLERKPAKALERGLRKVRALGVTHVSVSAPPAVWSEAALRKAQQAIAEAGLVLVWDLPVPFSAQNPIRLEAGAAPEAGAWLYLEPDGDVIRPSGGPDVLGNVLQEPMIELWRRAGEGRAQPSA